MKIKKTIHTKKKDAKTTIVSITACALPDCYTNLAGVFGLGSDGKVYFWDEVEGAWGLYKHYNTNSKRWW